MRVVSWAAGLAAAALTGVFSAVAAHAFKGHSGKQRVVATASPSHSPRARVNVPPPQHVPAIAGSPAAPPQPPPQAPQAAPPQQAPPVQQQAPAPQQAPPPPVSSGGS